MVRRVPDSSSAICAISWPAAEHGSFCKAGIARTGKKDRMAGACGPTTNDNCHLASDGP